MSFNKDDKKKKRVQEQISSLDVSELSMYTVMRMQNSKTYTFQRGEMYPNIMPPISQCGSSRTIDLFSQTMVDNGCGIFDPKILSKCRKNFSKTRLHTASSINNGKQLFHLYPMEQEERKPRQATQENVKKWCQLTPYELMRLQNCKSFKVANDESYPNVKPPASQCDPAKTVEWLIDSINYESCGRQFNMEEDDVLDVWKQSPNKHVLSYYGVRSATGTGPEAVRFNQVITKSLEKAASTRPAVEIKYDKPKPKVAYYTGICGSFVLNREQLSRKVKSMPTVQEKTNPHQAFTVLHCPKPVETEFPFDRTTSSTSLDIHTPAPKSKHSDMRKHTHCELKCGIPQNECTDYEWRKYLLNPAKYSEELESDLKQMQPDPADPEPRNYDELYANLISCFETCDRKDSLCDMYDKCCKHPKPDYVMTGSSRSQDRETKFVIKKVEQIIEEMEEPPQKRNTAAKEEEEKLEPSIDDIEKPKKEKLEKENQENEQVEIMTPRLSKRKKGKEKPENEEKKKRKNKVPEKVQIVKEDSGKVNTEKKKSEHGMSETDKFFKEKSEKEKKGHEPRDKKSEGSRSDIDIEQMTPAESKGTVASGRLEEPPQTPKPPKKKVPRGRKSAKKSGTPVAKDCPCVICVFMRRRDEEPDTPLISQLRREDKLRQMRDNLKQMCHREYMKCRRAEYPAPQHKCDPIVCDNFFCSNPKLGEYCDCLRAMEKLQKLLGPKHRIKKNEMIFNLEDLKSRICR